MKIKINEAISKVSEVNNGDILKTFLDYVDNGTLAKEIQDEYKLPDLLNLKSQFINALNIAPTVGPADKIFKKAEEWLIELYQDAHLANRTLYSAKEKFTYLAKLYAIFLHTTIRNLFTLKWMSDRKLIEAAAQKFNSTAPFQYTVSNNSRASYAPSDFNRIAPNYLKDLSTDIISSVVSSTYLIARDGDKYNSVFIVLLIWTACQKLRNVSYIVNTPLSENIGLYGSCLGITGQKIDNFNKLHWDETGELGVNKPLSMSQAATVETYKKTMGFENFEDNVKKLLDLSL